MASKSIKTLGLFVKPSEFDEGIGALLPKAYRKFYKEWKEMEPTAVHYVPEEGKWRRNETTGEVTPIQNVPIPLMFPKEANHQLWGGEGVVQGFEKRGLRNKPVPHFWVPSLKRTVVYSEVLDKYMSVIVTERALQLISTNYGFDHYLLKTPACDLKSLLPLRLKRTILKELLKGCPAYQKDSEKHKTILNEYGKYLDSYTPEEVEWYGYTFDEACAKMKEILKSQEKIVPLKEVYRAQLIENLKEAKESGSLDEELSTSPSWFQKLNPFGKKQET